MKLYGLQKMTLLDYPGRVACTVFLNGCDFRCPFCHNFDLATGASPAVMEDSELFEFLRSRRGLLDGVAVTGGEPCLNAGLPAFLNEVKALGFSVKLDTNGAHPKMLRRILEENLVDYVAMDIKNSPEKYALTCGRERVDLDAIGESVQMLLSGSTDYEFRTTCVRPFHEPDDFDKIGAWVRGARAFYLQAFVDRVSVPYGNLQAFSKEEMAAFLSRLKPCVRTCELRGL